MKDLEKAKVEAQTRANRGRQSFCVMEKTTGQYIVERHGFLSTPYGKGVYGGKQPLHVAHPR